MLLNDYTPCLRFTKIYEHHVSWSRNIQHPVFGIPNDKNSDLSAGNTWLQHEDEWYSRDAQSMEDK